MEAPPPPPHTEGINSTVASPNTNQTSMDSQSSSVEPIILLNHPISMKLTRTNYLAWQSQILPIPHGYGLSKYIEQSPPPTSSITDSTGQTIINPNFLPCSKQDQMVLGWLRSSLSETLLAQVVSCTTFSSLWIFLQSTFSATSRAQHAELRRRLQTTTKAGFSCSDYFQTMRSIADELAFIGSPVSDEDLVMQILGGLGPEFNPFVVAVNTSSRQDTLSLPDLQALLLSHEALLQSQVSSSPLPSASNPFAFYCSLNPMIAKSGTTRPVFTPVFLNTAVYAYTVGRRAQNVMQSLPCGFEYAAAYAVIRVMRSSMRLHAAVHAVRKKIVFSVN